MAGFQCSVLAPDSFFCVFLLTTFGKAHFDSDYRSSNKLEENI